MQQQLQPERGERIYERNNSADIRAREEDEGVDGSGDRADIPQQPVVKRVVAPQPMEIHCATDIYLQPVEHPTREQVDA